MFKYSEVSNMHFLSPCTAQAHASKQMFVCNDSYWDQERVNETLERALLSLVSSNSFFKPKSRTGMKDWRKWKDCLGDEDVTFLKWGNRECFQQIIRPLKNCF